MSPANERTASIVRITRTHSAAAFGLPSVLYLAALSRQQLPTWTTDAQQAQRFPEERAQVLAQWFRGVALPATVTTEEN